MVPTFPDRRWAIPREGALSIRQVFCLVLVAMGAAVLGGSGWAEFDNPIKIGALFQMIGPEAEYGRHGIQGARLAEKEINERGGVLGRKLQILVAHEGVATVGAQEARRFIREDGVDFLMGVDSSSVALAVSQEAKAHRKIVLFTHARASALTGRVCHRYAFRVASSAVMDARAAAVIMRDKPAKRWYGIGPDAEYDRDAWEVFQTALRKLRPDAVFVGESWTRGYTSDYTAVLNAALDAEPDAVWSTLWGRDLVTFIRQAQHLGFFERVKFFVNPGGASLGVLVPLGEEMPGGLWVSAGYWFLHPESVENRVFVNAYRALYAEYPADVALASYSALHLLRRVIEEVGSLDTEKIAERLEGITYRDPEGVKTIRQEDHQVVKDGIWGRTSKSDRFPFRILDDLVVVPVRDLVRVGDDTGCRMERP
jgi:branched-chain amino acid transport system substrate-binding protein